jgi:hypothetical protein
MIHLTATAPSQAMQCEAGRPLGAVGKAIEPIDDSDQSFRDVRGPSDQERTEAVGGANF